MAFARSHSIRHLYRTLEIREISFLFGISRSYTSNFDLKAPMHCYRRISMWSYNSEESNFGWSNGKGTTIYSMMAAESSISLNNTRYATTQAKAPPQVRKTGAKLSMVSAGIIYEPYGPRELISFLKRWFTRSGWRRTKEDVILELKNAYAISKLRKSGYSKKKFYQEAVQLYKEINTLMGNGKW